MRPDLAVAAVFGPCPHCAEPVAFETDPHLLPDQWWAYQGVDLLVLTTDSKEFLTTLNSEGMRSAQKLADVLQQNPGRTVFVEGYTDNIGSDDYNQRLSEKRAAAVEAFLVGHGVDGSKIQASGRGKANPVADNSTEQGRAQNRRVEVLILPE